MVPAAPIVTVLVNVELSALTSKPVGEVTTIPSVILAPDTLNAPDAEAVP